MTLYQEVNMKKRSPQVLNESCLHVEKTSSKERPWGPLAISPAVQVVLLQLRGLQLLYMTKKMTGKDSRKEKKNTVYQ